MAFPAFSVTCNYSGTPNYNESTPSLPGVIVWQEAPATGVLSTNSVPAISKQSGPCVLTAYATADSWFSYGASPSSAGALRVQVPAATLLYFTAEAGDKFMWQAA